MEGELTLALAGERHVLGPGGYADLPPATDLRVRNESESHVRFHWIRKAYEPSKGLDAPEPLFLNERDIAPTPMPDTDGRWATTHFVEPADMRHDMHVTIVTRPAR